MMSNFDVVEIDDPAILGKLVGCIREKVVCRNLPESDALEKWDALETAQPLKSSVYYRMVPHDPARTDTETQFDLTDYGDPLGCA